MIITEQCRRESFYQTDRKTRREVVLDALTEPMTAREILHKVLPFSSDMNAVRPRITELIKQGKVTECDRKFDDLTGRTVTVFKKA